MVEFTQRAATDQGQGATQPVTDTAKRLKRTQGKSDEIRLDREFKQGAVHVQEQCAGIIQLRRWRAARGNRDGHCPIMPAGR